MPKKVLIITNVPAPYRVDFFYYLQTQIPQYEFHILYSSVSDRIGRQWHTDQDKIIQSHFLKSRVFTIHNRYDDKQIIFPYGVAKILAQLQPDVVVGSEYNPTILQAVHWCKKNKIPYISWSDGTRYSERNINTLQKLFRKYVVKRAKAFIGSSTRTVENQQYLGASPDKCFLSLLTVDIQQYLLRREADEPNHYNLLYVGSLIGRKGLDLLLDSLALTDERISLTIVGEGGEKEGLTQQMERLGLQDRVIFKGFLEGEALKKSYENADVFVLPTREDCFGLVILEAMCASMPVIVSEYADGAVDLVTDGENGYIVDPNNSEEMAKAIDTIFEQTEQLNAMRQASYKRAQGFAFEHVAEGFIAAIDSVWNG
ncbi:MAG: glycosyltransferase family 4 protein [Clostridiales bacterium]|nr:glycosyltransferase family 4 protein [Clostridiales bacterium]